MNARRFKTLGMTDSPGHCDLCGTMCPRRRVAVELVLEDGSLTGDVQYWGVVCAAEARHGRRDSSLARMMRDEAEQAGTYDAASRPARVARARCRSTVRRQSSAAHRDALIVWTRTAGPLPGSFAGDKYAAADCRYRMTGRQTTKTHYGIDDAGNLARIDDNDPADVARFTARGFVHHCGQWTA